MDAKEAFLAFKEQRIDENQFAKSIFPTLKRIARIVAFRQGVDPDDLTSELWLLTRTKLVDSFDPTQPNSNSGIEPFLMGCAKLIGSPNGVRNLRSPPEEICATDLYQNECEDGSDSCSGQALIESEVDPYAESALAEKYRQCKLDEILLRLSSVKCDNEKNGLGYIQVDEVPNNMKTSAVAGVRIVTQQFPEKIQHIDLPKRPAKNTSNLSADQAELVKIRHQLGYSQDLFAKALNIGVPCLASYEYGRTAGVPAHVMAAARGLLQELGCNDAKEFENIPMSKILDRWATQLSIPYSDDNALSKALTVSKATISRWKNNKTRPPLVGKPGRPGEPGKLGLKQLEELVLRLRSK